MIGIPEESVLSLYQKSKKNRKRQLIEINNKEGRIKDLVQILNKDRWEL